MEPPWHSWALPRGSDRRWISRWECDDRTPISLGRTLPLCGPEFQGFPKHDARVSKRPEVARPLNPADRSVIKPLLVGALCDLATSERRSPLHLDHCTVNVSPTGPASEAARDRNVEICHGPGVGSRKRG